MAAASNGKRASAPTGAGAGCRPAFQTSDQSALRKLLECPICKRIAKSPIHTCQDDKHLICEECLETLTQGNTNANTRCPICSTQISETRSTYIEQCMDGILLDCHYKNDGCQLNLKATEYRDHLLVCYYREIPCVMLNCGETVGFKEFFTHLKTKHKDKVNGVENANRHVVEWWIEGDSRDAIARWPPYFFTCFNNVFLYTAISTIHGMWEWVYILADKAEASRFQVVANITNPDKTAELRWKGVVHPIGKPIEEIAESGLCFVTNSKEMRNPYIFQKKNKERHYWRTDVEIVELKPPKPGAIPYIVTTHKHIPHTKGKIIATGTSARRLSLENDPETGHQENGEDSDSRRRSKPKSDNDTLPFSEKAKSDRKPLKITDEIPSTSTSEKPKIPLSDIGNQNEESSRPRARSVKMMDTEQLEKFSEEVVAAAEDIEDRSGRKKSRQRSVKILDTDELVRFSEEVVAEEDIDDQSRRKNSTSTSKKPDIGKQNDESPRPRARSVKMMDTEQLEKFSEEVLAEDQRGRKKTSIREGSSNETSVEDDKGVTPGPTPIQTVDPEQAKTKKSVYKVAELEDDRYFETDNTK